MSNKCIGGYVIVDATGLDVSDTETQTISGLYAQLEAALSSKKPIVLVGMVNGDSEVSPTYVSAIMGKDDTITLSGFALVVTNDDEVTPESDESGSDDEVEP